MKTKTVDPKQVYHLARRIQTNTYNLLLNKKIRLDRRFKLNREILNYLRLHPLTASEIATIKAKKKARAINKRYTFTNVYNLPIVKDYLANKREIVCIIL